MKNPRTLSQGKNNPLIALLEKSMDLVRKLISQYFIEVVLKIARRNVNRFKKIKSLDEHQREIHLSKIRHFEIRFAKRTFLYRLIRSPVEFLSVLATVLSFFIAPFIAKLVLKQPLDIFLFLAVGLNLILFYVLAWSTVILITLLPSISRTAVLFLHPLVFILLTMWLANGGFQLAAFFSASVAACQTFF